MAFIEKQGIGGKIKFNIGLATKIGYIEVLGILEEFTNGKKTNVYVNTAHLNLKKALPKGVKDATMNAINKARFNWSGGNYVDTTTLSEGGAGATDNAKFSFEWKNEEGASKTITSLDIGYALGEGGEVIYAQKTGMSKVVADDDTVGYIWTITMALNSGDVANSYRYYLAKLLAAGTFNSPNKFKFGFSGGSTDVSSSYESGGDGTETFVKYSAVYTAPAGGKTITYVYMIYDSGSAQTEYYTADITDKALDEDDTLTAYIQLEHNPT